VVSVLTTEASSSRWPAGADGFDPVAETSARVAKLISYSDWSDIALVEAVVDSCGEAYSELYRRHFRSVSAAARMILGSTEECEDVVADVFLGLWLAPEKFDPARGTLLGYLRLKSKARSLDILRSVTSRRRRERGDRQIDRDLAQDVDSAMLASESASTLRAALSLLPSVEQDPIYLAFFVGMPYASVAEQLRLPEGTVKSRIRSGLMRLRLSGDLQDYLTEHRHEPNDVPAPLADGNVFGGSRIP
jgi:RNA polymerase sigma-70 factor, ECF subfamily